MNTVMIIAPHHDDEVIGCGGSICLHKSKNDKVTIVFFTAGWSAIPWISDRQEAAKIIQEEAIAAGKILGVDKIIELNFEDRNLQNSQVILSPLVSTIRKVRPNIIYLPHPNDGDGEHRFVNAIAIEAIWISSSDYLPELGTKAPFAQLILGYEVWQPMSSYNLSVNITDQMERKLAAIKTYNSQLKQKNWQKGLLGLASFRGVTSSKGEYAEVFQVIKVNSQFLKM